MDETKVEEESFRKLMLFQAERIGSLSDKSIEQGVKVSSWLSASLLAVNSGGAVTAIQAIEKLSSPWLPVSFFSAGMLLSMGSGVIIQFNTTKLLPRFERGIQILQKMALGMKLEQESLIELEDLAKPQGARWLAPLTGWLSALAFVAGGFALVADLTGHKAASTQPQPSVDMHTSNARHGQH